LKEEGNMNDHLPRRRLFSWPHLEWFCQEMWVGMAIGAGLTALLLANG
jgi:hypothetical protein